MHVTKRQEQFSQAVVHAVASCAGCAVGNWAVDDDSIDVTLRSKLYPSKPKLDIQLKCTWQDIEHNEHELRFPLQINNYEDLRSIDIVVPRILVIMRTPAHIGTWIDQTENEMALRRCAYWVSLRGEPATTNLTTQTVTIPRCNIFTPAALEAMMAQIDYYEGQP